MNSKNIGRYRSKINFNVLSPAQTRLAASFICVLLLYLVSTVIGLANSMLPTRVLSASGQYSIKLVPEEKPIHIGKLHRWVVTITERQSNQKVRPDTLEVSGGMPAHGHGLPSNPVVTEYNPETGWYIDGVKFNMAGLWEMTVRFKTENKWDSATIKISVGHRVNTMSHDWSQAEKAILKSLQLGSKKPKEDPTSRVSDDTRAQKFGMMLFFDSKLSKNGAISCGTCHQSEKYFTDGLTTAIGEEKTNRNTPTLIGSSEQNWLYWDGRRDSLWSQALVPLEAKEEMANNRLRIVKYIKHHHKQQYESIFGKFPELSDNLPDNAGPTGTEAEMKAWKSIPAKRQLQINSVFSNIGKAIAAFERTLQPLPTRFDKFVELLTDDKEEEANRVFSMPERMGLKLFINNKSQCLNCHNSPLFTNFGFHNIGTGMDENGIMDFGRMLGSQAALLSEFNCRSEYNDDQSGNCPELDYLNQDGHSHSTRGAFKVPTLRGINLTAPYMHDGRFSTLEEVMDFYIEPPAISGTMRHELPALSHLNENDRQNLLAFLRALGEGSVDEASIGKSSTDTMRHGKH